MENLTKWTPGPWRLGLVSDTTVQTLDGKIVAEVDGDYNQPELWPIMEANARLIAAAPELYAALDGALAEHFERDGMSLAPEHWSNAARAALAKARGDAP